jgi:catechol 2,3-dioxygenase-like lactoylglutathione lyase family enzyme
MIPFKIMSHVSVTVTDLEKAKAFYEGVLGLRQIPRPDFGFPGVWYSLGGDLQLHIIVNETLTRPPVERERFEPRYPHFALWSDDADETARRLAESGAHFYDFTSTPTGLRQLFIKDPDGNVIEFIGPTREPRTRRME